MDEFMIIVSGLCSAVWTINAISEIIEKEPIDSFCFIIKVLNAVIWIIVFVMRMIKYRRKHRDQ